MTGEPGRPQEEVLTALSHEEVEKASSRQDALRGVGDSFLAGSVAGVALAAAGFMAARAAGIRRERAGRRA